MHRIGDAYEFDVLVASATQTNFSHSVYSSRVTRYVASSSGNDSLLFRWKIEALLIPCSYIKNKKVIFNPGRVLIFLPHFPRVQWVPRVCPFTCDQTCPLSISFSLAWLFYKQKCFQMYEYIK